MSASTKESTTEVDSLSPQLWLMMKILLDKQSTSTVGVRKSETIKANVPMTVD